MNIFCILKSKKTVEVLSDANSKEEMIEELYAHMNRRDGNITDEYLFECKEGLYPYEMAQDFYIKYK